MGTATTRKTTTAAGGDRRPVVRLALLLERRDVDEDNESVDPDRQVRDLAYIPCDGKRRAGGRGERLSIEMQFARASRRTSVRDAARSR